MMKRVGTGLLFVGACSACFIAPLLVGLLGAGWVGALGAGWGWMAGAALIAGATLIQRPGGAQREEHQLVADRTADGEPGEHSADRPYRPAGPHRAGRDLDSEPRRHEQTAQHGGRDQGRNGVVLDRCHAAKPSVGDDVGRHAEEERGQDSSDHEGRGGAVPDDPGSARGRRHAFIVSPYLGPKVK